MPLYDRPYMKDESTTFDGGGSGGGLAIGLPKPARAVKILLIVNIVVFVVQMFLDDLQGRAPGSMSRWGGVTVNGSWQLWRYFTFQFLHAGFWHIALNMLGLYLLGSHLERHFGTRRFLWFYLSCGVVAGVAYVIIGALDGVPPDMPIIGASGGVYGIVLACAVLFPQFRLIFLFFPVPIRLAAIIIFGGMILMVLQAMSAGRTSSVMSDVAHLGGAVAAAVWIWVLPKMRAARVSTRQKLNKGAWERKMKKRAAEQAEIDRILRKIHDDGLDSLSTRERRTLRDATKRRQKQDNDLYRL